ncbi:hypothetical protein BIU97_05705 [Curtobacterium sp. MCBA15_009]|uniref:hypothetical protein n=1 Tax=Curtobacterium sp. MCBA15_009 TaxID=1898737 RepID=UPI0008DE9F5E|nr:hypothetical protein [Curtobacterium sp. MCBA15_009]OII11399.1 hypothetical protein BIU97_05705 [Curtobacterium sp. MCBA15_009]
MGEQATAADRASVRDDDERERRRRAQRTRRRRQRLRRTLRQRMDWRGARVPVGAWWFAVLAVALGVLYGRATDAGDPGVGGPGADALGAAVAGAAIGVGWGALLFACAPPLVAVPLAAAGVFCGFVLVGPLGPGAVSASLVASVAGWLLGMQLRYLVVGRRRPPERARLVDRGRPRRAARITPGERSQLVATGVSGVLAVVVPALLLLVPAPAAFGTWLVLVLVTLAWSGPVGWWTGMVRSHHAAGGAPFAAAQWGLLFNAWGSAGVHALPITLTAGMAGVGLGFVLRRLHEARVGRYPRERPAAG